VLKLQQDINATIDPINARGGADRALLKVVFTLSIERAAQHGGNLC
jgi:hypothetical protein